MRLIVVCVVLFLLTCPGIAEELEQEYVTTTPVLLDGVLYVASSSYPDRRGHLRAIDVLDTIAVTLWDAAEKMPVAGDDSLQPANIVLGNTERSLFTNGDQDLLPLDAAAAAVLQDNMAVESLQEAEALIQSLRGRRGGSVHSPAGYMEDPQRLWSFSRSSPIVVGNSQGSPAMAGRDRVLYSGTDDGLLHAFYVSSFNRDSGSYPVYEPEGGTELWGYLPGSFLPYLKDQPILEPEKELAVSLDGSPQVREVFVDLDGDGLRRWHTLLAASGTIYPERRSSLFVLDVTEPYDPKLLWENLVPGDGAGRTRGLRIGDCDASRAGCLYLSTDSRNTDENGLHVLAATLDDGELLWQFGAPYGEQGAVAEATPATPVLANFDNDKTKESLVVGDMLGQLWVIDIKTGQARGEAPVFTSPGGLAEPIGTEVALWKNIVVFATGGVGAAVPEGGYKLYAVEILPEGARLRWSYPLLPGEKAWGTPQFDQLGNLLLATSRGFRASPYVAERSTSGRMIVLNKDGEEIASRETDAATVGRVVTAPGVALSVDLTGKVTQFGTPTRLSGSAADRGSVRVFSWRQP